MITQNSIPAPSKITKPKAPWVESYLNWVKERKLQLLPFIVLLLALPVIVAAQKAQTRLFSNAAAAPKPDVVVVMVDDMGSIDDRLLNRLPNIKALFVDQGMRFDNAYDETPLCCPGRATFLSGQHTRNHGVTYNKASLLNPQKTIAVAMHNAGYYTIMTGKYLNQPQTLSDKTPDGWDKVAMLYDWNGSTSSRFWVQGTLKTEGFMDRFTADQSLTYLKGAPSGQPIFMWVNSHAPHKTDDSLSNKPWDTDIEAKYVGDSRCANIQPWKPANYNLAGQPNGFPLEKVCDSLLTMDDNVGALRAEMARQGRNPIWIFTSDNGMAWGSDGYPMKNVPQSAKSPLFFTGPGIPHLTTQALVSQIDLSPTIAELAGASMPWKDGISFASILTTGSNSFRAWMIEDHPLGGNDRSGSTTGPWWGIITPQWAYAEWAKRGNLLFDLVNDPNKLHNLASTRPDIIASLKTLIDTTDPILPQPTGTPTPTSTISAIPSLTPTPTPAVGFVESQGVVAFEAEHYFENITRNNHTWGVVADVNVSLGQYINTTNSGLQLSPPNSAQVQYPIYFSTPGTYYVWLRSYSPQGTSNAISVGIDGVPTVAPINSPTYKTWIWGDKDANKKAVTINITTPGLHTFSVWERKDGTRLDKIALSISSVAPSGFGPSESPSPTPLPTSTPTPTLTPTPTETPTPSATDTPTPELSGAPTPTFGGSGSLVKWLETPYKLPSESYIDDE